MGPSGEARDGEGWDGTARIVRGGRAGVGRACRERAGGTRVGQGRQGRFGRGGCGSERQAWDGLTRADEGWRRQSGEDGHGLAGAGQSKWRVAPTFLGIGLAARIRRQDDWFKYDRGVIFRVVVTDDPDTNQMRWLRHPPEIAIRGDTYFDTALGVACIHTGVAWLKMMVGSNGTYRYK